MPTPNDNELPSYAARVQTPKGSEHHKYLERSKGQKWLSLFVKSWARDAASMPMFFENADISGRVEVDLDKAESIKGITISVSHFSFKQFQIETFYLLDPRRNHLCRSG
jgi:hypothetical protein